MSNPLRARVTALIARGAADLTIPAEIAARDALALDIFHWQRTHNPVYARIADVFLDAQAPLTVADIPAVPTDVFKTARVACFPPEATVRTFRTSGTTGEVRGEHPFDDLSLYAAGAQAAAARWLLPAKRYHVVCIAQDETLAPDSSLSYMLQRFAETWAPAQRRPFYVEGAVLDAQRCIESLIEPPHEAVPVALLGASWGFVHLADAMERLGVPSISLPPDSVAMPTGGYKGKSRELSPSELEDLLTRRFNLRHDAVIGEYGMTELSSQAYEARREGAPPGCYRAPPWLIVSVVDPESLRPLPHDTVGLLRLVDLANIGSAIAIQTSDLGRTHPDGFSVLGRVPGATPRGCARALDALLSS